jgi:hypothetical protein
MQQKLRISISFWPLFRRVTRTRRDQFMPEQIARQSAVRVNLSSGFSRNTPVRFAVAHLLCYGLRRQKVEMISAGGHFPSCADLELHHKG